MMSSLPLLIIAFLLPLILTLPIMMLNFHTTQDQEKASPFECGFDPPMKSRSPFSLRFFLLAVLFLIFDIEIVVILPLPLLIATSPLSSYAFPFYAFMFMVSLGLLHEWNEGTLNWKL